jgi:tetratricopeptide (TPR) repeat protein
MPSVLKDRYGAQLGATDEQAVGLWDEAVHELVALAGDPMAKAAAAATADGELGLAFSLQAYLHCYLTSRTAHADARAILGHAPKPVCGRDEAHHQAASAWVAGDLEAATRHLERALLMDPRDLLALKVAQDLYFFLGDRVNLRDVAARVLPAWPRGTPGAGFVEAMYAFGLEECGDYGAAERHGRAALDADRRDVWAAHAVIHVLEMEGRQPEGIAFVNASAPDWGPSYFAPHNWWHFGLYHLELRREPEALAVYDGPLVQLGLTSPLYQVDAASLLWRLSLQGAPLARRAEELADAFEASLGDSAYCFNDWHAVMALGLAGRLGTATRLVADLSGSATGTNKAMLDRAGSDVIQGFLAFASGDYRVAAELLGRARPHAHAFGGSHAQRDAIDLTLLAAASAAHDDNLVRALMAERLARKPTAEAAAHRVVEVNRDRAAGAQR